MRVVVGVLEFMMGVEVEARLETGVVDVIWLSGWG